MNYLKPSPRNAANHALYRSRSVHTSSPSRRYPSVTSDAAIGDAMGVSDVEGESTIEDDPLHLMLKEKWAQTEGKIAALFSEDARSRDEQSDTGLGQNVVVEPPVEDPSTTTNAKKPARTIEDDYGDDDDEDEHPAQELSPLQAKSKVNLPNGVIPPLPRSPSHSLKLTVNRTSTSSSTEQGKSIEDVRKKLEEDKKAAEEAAKRSFHTMFFTLESDRDAMLEQQKLDELDRQVENEMGDGAHAPIGTEGQDGAPAQGSLSSADLGASSLTLKHLIARIDAQRNRVRANDTQLRSLISEVRKGRSKWASEDKVGQEELYEAAEKVLMELKAMTEYSTPFLQRVNKRDAPDYFHVIRHPMDIGSMIKKLKGLQYKSKKEFVADLSLIWSNCLTYNADPNHPLRKKALHMRKETDKLIPLIPEITVRDRAEVEAEERRNQGLDNELDGGEDSDDDLPIMASRGRKAPSKGKKGVSNSARESAKPDGEDTASNDQKPAVHVPASNSRSDLLRADSDAPGETTLNGFSTPPPPGSSTPMINGIHSSGAPHAQDTMDVDSVAPIAPAEDPDEDDVDYRTWKQVTKKDRAMAAADRNHLFRGNHLNPDEPALLRNKAGMRRWMRQQKQYMQEKQDTEMQAEESKGADSTGETLAEGIEKDEDRTLPDYYDMLTAIPGIDEQLRWQEDSEGKVIPQSEKYLRVFPQDQFKFNESILTNRMESNMRQMQETRKICAKIGIVKQMQIQAQTYQNQFQKYDPEPFVEQDIGAVAVSEDGPIMAPWVCRAAFQRSVGKIFYHAGFEDFQPSALDAVTDLAADYFSKLTQTLRTYAEAPPTETAADKFSAEEQVLHCLHENGIDLDSLDTYVKEDVERLGSKLVVVHDRLRYHLAELLRPALGDGAGTDGVGAFNDGSEQFVGGDFAEDIDEDFFGFKELGLADELGLETLSVPLHLLQNRVHSAYNANNQHVATVTGVQFPPPEPYDKLTTENLPSHIGLVQDFFATKLASNNGRPLVEDEDLPPKQRFPKPRLGPTGKISSPRKRPLREQQQMAKKKRKLEENRDKEDSGNTAPSSRPIKPLKLEMPEVRQTGMEPEKDQAGKNNGLMLSPESITVN